MSTTPLNTHQHTQWSPGSRWGSWSVSTAALAVGGTATLAIAIAFALGLEPADSFSDIWWLTAAGLAILASAAAAAATGILALVRRHDRSWSVVTATVAGVLLTGLMLQQVAEGLGWLTG